MIELLAVAREIAENPKTGQVIAGATVTTGVGTWTDFIPDGIGKVATCVGIVLSIVVIYTTIRREQRDRTRDKLELAKLRLEVADHLNSPVHKSPECHTLRDVSAIKKEKRKP